MKTPPCGAGLIVASTAIDDFLILERNKWRGKGGGGGCELKQFGKCYTENKVLFFLEDTENNVSKTFYKIYSGQ